MTPAPLPPADTRPEMSAHEASWHEHLAGMRAEDAARAMGADPLSVEAVASATAGPRLIGRHTMRSANQGTVWTLKKIAAEFAKYAEAHGLLTSDDDANPGERELIELGLTCLVFADARRVWNMVNSGALPALVEQAQDIIWETPLEEQMELQAHFRAEMGTLARLSGPADDREKKPTPAQPSQAVPSGTFSAMPNPPPATASPAWSGSPASMPISPLKQPSGRLR